MDTLLVISGELIVLPMLLAAALVFELVSGVLIAGLQFLLGHFQRRQAHAAAVGGRIPGLGLLRRIRSSLGSLFGAVLLLTLVAELFFFEAAVRWAANRVEDYAGLHVEFESAEGSFFRGRLELQGMTIARDEAGKNAIDLRVERFLLDVSMLDVFADEKRVTALEVEGMRGRVERRAVAMGKGSATRRDFVAERVDLRDIELEFVDRTREQPLELAVVLEELRVSPLRSRWALFDLLYRTNAKGSIDGFGFEAVSTQSTAGRITTWRAPDLPLAMALPYLGAGGRWLKGGRIEIAVVDRWLINETPPEITMDYRLVLRDLDISIPADLSAKEKALALPVALAAEKLGKEIPLEFSVVLDEDQFEGAASLEAIGLFSAASGALAKAMMESTGVEAGKLQSWGKIGAGLLESALDDD